ncbi:MAG TPA: hypothetical protein VGC21_15120 [Telluria sp.]
MNTRIVAAVETRDTPAPAAPAPEPAPAIGKLVATLLTVVSNVWLCRTTVAVSVVARPDQRCACRNGGQTGPVRAACGPATAVESEHAGGTGCRDGGNQAKVIKNSPKNENDGIAPSFPRPLAKTLARNINSLYAASTMQLVVHFEQIAANTQ